MAKQLPCHAAVPGSILEQREILVCSTFISFVTLGIICGSLGFP